MRSRITRILAVITACAVCAVVVYAAGTAGSESDPVVTKSYVDSAVSNTKSYVDSAVSKAKSSLEESIAIVSSGGSVSGSAISTGNSFAVVQVPAGKQLIGGAGAQIILRSGEAAALAVSTNGIINGVSDLTTGKDLKTGDLITKDHLLLVPRGDGRGVNAMSDLYVMVLGSYKIE